ncbi:hypothetical protein CLOHAE12215_02570 [Clostridium haemolyticum]|uniref:hypothetical protein n=1 Tax=Clostridium TaxID=1485 RepID=UPI0013F9EB90|nr:MULTISPECIES: hypothetical protein [Clostridium]MCD3217823.1 hypothetical protein [Clostridium botulinum C]NFV48086.1 hypothetical protein [Clostridium botulinum]CAG7841146.1 hypothetical protein CLOHAE12215_02570 [Clostridium haemolyticum]
MIYVFEDINNFTSIVYDETILTKEEKTRGIAVEHLPPNEEKEGQIAILKADKEKNKVWYEYVKDTRFKEDAKIEDLKQELKQCQQSIIELTALASTVAVAKK